MPSVRDDCHSSAASAPAEQMGGNNQNCEAVNCLHVLLPFSSAPHLGHWRHLLAPLHRHWRSVKFESASFVKDSSRTRKIRGLLACIVVFPNANDSTPADQPQQERNLDATAGPRGRG